MYVWICIYACIKLFWSTLKMYWAFKKLKKVIVHDNDEFIMI